MSDTVTDMHISNARVWPTAASVKKAQPVDTPASVIAHRATIANILDGTDPRMLIVAGPCSVHDTHGTVEYGKRYAALADAVKDQIYLVMRTCIEKPRSLSKPDVWPGMVWDPDIRLDGVHNLDKGIREARRILLALNRLGVPVMTEVVTPGIVQYLDDVLAGVWVGARDVASSSMRRLASGLSMPAGFKNSTGGSIQDAVDGVRSALQPNYFNGPDGETGRLSTFDSTGNPNAFIILRGGPVSPNYEPQFVDNAFALLARYELPMYLMVDCSHKNSGGNHRRQADVLQSVIDQRLSGKRLGAMLESFIVEGRQDVTPHTSRSSIRGDQSITDACLSWQDTEELVRNAARALAASPESVHA